LVVAGTTLIEPLPGNGHLLFSDFNIPALRRHATTLKWTSQKKGTVVWTGLIWLQLFSYVDIIQVSQQSNHTTPTATFKLFCHCHFQPLTKRHTNPPENNFQLHLEE
jgi:hypothetical protein